MVCRYFCNLRGLLVILYVVCFGCYVLYTRNPDYFDGETSPAAIHWMYDSLAHRTVPKALFRQNQKNYAIDARYVFREWKEGDKLEVIFDNQDPSKAAVYALWGYWIRWEELIGSVVILVVLFQVAVAITKDPTPGAVIEQLEGDQETTKKRRYL